MSRIGDWIKERRIGDWIGRHGVVSALILATAAIVAALIGARGDDPPPATIGQATTTVPSEAVSDSTPDPPTPEETTTSSSPPQDPGDAGTTTTSTTVPPQDETADAGEAPESAETTTTTSSPPPEPEDAGTTTTTVLQEETENQEALDAYKFDVELGGCAGVSGSDQWCFFGGHATSYVAWRLNEVNFASTDEFFHNRYLMDASDRWGHATEWDDAARRLGITVDGHPAPGSVAQWESGTGTTYGFVAYVEEVHYDDAGDVSSVVLSYMNTDRKAVTTVPDTWTLEEDGRCARAECALDLGWPHSFIHIKDLDSAPAS